MTALLAAVLADLPQLDGAACRDRAPWFDVDHVGDETDDQRAARLAAAAAVCRRCPALAPCRDLVRRLPAAQRRGVWGGQVYGRPSPRPTCSPQRPAERPRMPGAAETSPEMPEAV